LLVKHPNLVLHATAGYSVNELAYLWEGALKSAPVEAFKIAEADLGLV
jgi:hypothetical protein